MGLIKYNRNHEKYAEPAPLSREMPKVMPDIKIAGILKEKTFNSLLPECTLVRLTKENYKSILYDDSIAFLFVDDMGFYEKDETDNIISRIILEFKIVKKCCVYWDTDSSENFYKNIKIIKNFDFVFTVNKNSIDDYKKALEHENVFYLPFAVQPQIYNPISKNIINNENRILRRFVDIERVLGSSYKLHSVTFKDGITFVPDEIFELLALGTPMITPYFKEIEDLFGHIIKVYESDSQKEEILQSLLKDKDAIDKLSLLGLRSILNSHTYTNRLRFILQTIGLLNQLPKLPGVSMVTSTNRLDSMDNIFTNYENQNYENKELIIILNNNKLDLEEWKSKAESYKNVKVFQIDESEPLGTCLNYAIDNSDFPYFSKCDDDNYYAPNFLSDLMGTFKYADAEIVGKLSYYCYLEGCKTLAIMCPNMEHRYVNMLSGSALIIKREVFDKVRFRFKPAGSDTVFLKECISNGVKMYSADRFNYVYKRHPSQNNHTWKMEDDVFLKSCKVIDILDNYTDILTI